MPAERSGLTGIERLKDNKVRGACFSAERFGLVCGKAAPTLHAPLLLNHD